GGERALGPSGALHRLGAGEVDAGADLAGACAEHDDDAVAARDHRLHDVLEQWAAAQRRELLGTAEARALARREDDAADQAPTSWMRPPARPSRPPSRPCRTATISARIDSAVSSDAVAPRSRPIGAASRSRSASVSPAASRR